MGNDPIIPSPLAGEGGGEGEYTLEKNRQILNVII